MAIPVLLACPDIDFHAHPPLPGGGEMWEESSHVVFDRDLKFDTVDTREYTSENLGPNAQYVISPQLEIIIEEHGITNGRLLQ